MFWIVASSFFCGFPGPIDPACSCVELEEIPCNRSGTFYGPWLNHEKQCYWTTLTKSDGEPAEMDQHAKAAAELAKPYIGDPGALARRLGKKVTCTAGAQHILGPFGVDCDLRRWGLKLAERGGKNGKKRVIVATARKLAALLHHLWVSGEVYEPLHNSQPKAVPRS